MQRNEKEIQRVISERNVRLFEAEAEKLGGRADDLKIGLEREIKELDRQVKEAHRAAMVASSIEEDLAGQRRIKSLQSERARIAVRCSTRRMTLTSSDNSLLLKPRGS